MKLLALASFAMTSACMVPRQPTAAEPARIDTPSGQPEIIIDGFDPAAVSAKLVETYALKGWEIRSQTSNTLVMWRPDVRPEVRGSRYDPTPMMEAKFAFVPAGDDGTKLMLQLFYVANEASGFERREQYARRDDLEVAQKVLSRAKGFLLGTIDPSTDFDEARPETWDWQYAKKAASGGEETAEMPVSTGQMVRG